MILPPALALSHQLIRQVTQPGDIVIDATVGNGHDTCFLAECVGPTGKVYGFDIQSLALTRTAERLLQQNLLERVHLIHAGHEAMRQFIPDEHHGAIRAVMFNLGYLPGSDKSVTTQADTTIAALEAALHLLTLGGLISVVIYSGHPAGKMEQSALYQWASQLDQQAVHVAVYQFLNQKGNPPSLMAMEKKGDFPFQKPNPSIH
ncbi:MAG: class I SAM-dependent methyltransferase [Alicyclobacillaceae bacterium]|nr:class I SAM-dependent methyltransferase [Alicyclobacillaceae bacterium]